MHRKATPDLESSQSDPLWHLASYVKHRRNGPEDNLVWWREQPAYVWPVSNSRGRCVPARSSAARRSACSGTFVMSRGGGTEPDRGVALVDRVAEFARPWREALAGIRVPRKSRATSSVDPLEVRAFYFKRMLYESRSGGGLTPVFVAGEINRFEPLPEGPLTSAVKYGFAALVAGVVMMFFLMSRQDRRLREELEVQLAAKRRKRTAGEPRDAEAVSGTT